MITKPIALGIAALFLPKIVDAILAPSAKQKSFRVSPAQAARFTRVEDNARHFDAHLARALPAYLTARGATLEPASPRAPNAQVWRIGPLRPGAPNASDVIARAREQGLAVAGSLSLVLLPTGKPAPMVLVTAPLSELAQLTEPSSQLAVIDPPAPAPKSETAAEVVRRRKPAPPIANGKADHVPAPVEIPAAEDEPKA